jgi:dTDP-4-dehydrorhamnose 3,5-epimerase-like enzyme
MNKMPKLKVERSGIIKLQNFDDFPDGNLTIAESLKNIPFSIKRIYYINNLFNKGAVRGKHAHKKLDQVIFCINGNFVLGLDDGKTKQKILLNDPSWGIRLGSKLWHTMEKFSSDCVILVLANDYYKKDDYLRDYDEFIKYLKKG